MTYTRINATTSVAVSDPQDLDLPYIHVVRSAKKVLLKYDSKNRQLLNAARLKLR